MAARRWNRQSPSYSIAAAIATCSAGGVWEPPRPGGVVALLIPAKLATSGYAEPLRRRLSHSARIERAYPLPEPVARSFGAAVYPMALVAARADPSGMERVATALGPKPAAPSVSQRQLQRDGPWILAPGPQRVSRRLRAQFPIVRGHWTPQLGVKTGADDLFLLDRECSGSRPAVPRRGLTPWRARPRPPA